MAKRKAIDYHDPPTLYALVTALPPGKKADRAWAEYAGTCTVYQRLVLVLGLLGVAEADIPALMQADDKLFGHAIAVAYRESIEDQGYAWLPELARARRVAQGDETPDQNAA